MSDTPRVVILYNPHKPAAKATVDLVAAKIADHATIQRIGPIDEAETMACSIADRIIVFGGDGSILGVARAMARCQVPIIGVNFGKLGYLADYNPPDLVDNIERVLSDESLLSRRMMIGGTVHRANGATEELLAVNDMVVLAGPPFRMIELTIRIDGEHLTNLRGDGVVLATPTGSTAHNMSVGGPIIQSEINAISLAPISPHSLTHRPLVIAGTSEIEIQADNANAGTTIVVDGQVYLPLDSGDRLRAHRYPNDFLMVRNPAYQAWHTLTQKLKWGQ